MAFGPAMAQSGATLGCCWLGAAGLWASSVEGQGQCSPPNDGGGGFSASCSVIWHHVLHVTGGTVACLLAGGCASVAKGFS